MKHVLVDTGFWYAAFDSKDPYHQQAQDKMEFLGLCHLLIPWPTMYETLCTRLVRNKFQLQQFEIFLKKPNISYLDDAPYREEALSLSMKSSLRRGRPLSMVDCMIRLTLEDENTKVNYLATFNEIDFSDLCSSCSFEII